MEAESLYTEGGHNVRRRPPGHFGLPRLRASRDPRGKARSHLATCDDCQRFEAEATALAGFVNLQASRRAPESLKELLAGELARTVGPPPLQTRPRLWRPRPAIGWRRGVQWVGALAPAAAVAVVVPLGVLSSPMGHPTHPSTPCTAHLTSHLTPKVGHHFLAPLPKEREAT